MSSINNVNSAANAAPVQKVSAAPAARTAAAVTPPAPTRAADRLELSGASHLLKTLKTNDVRAEKVADIRAQLAAGTYEDDAKLDGATDKLLDDLLK